MLVICFGSNITLKVFGSFTEHQFSKFKAADCKVTMNFDDQPYFLADLKREYDSVSEHFGMHKKALLTMIHMVIESTYIDHKTKLASLARLDGQKTLISADKTVI